MSDAPAIAFRHVHKFFRNENVLSHGLKGLLLHLPNVIKEARHTRYHTVLDDVSFEIARGESVAFIGRNGTGKSTSLGLMAGVLRPNAGTVEVNGHICPLLELGAGFRPQLSGAENIFLNGVLLGMTRRQVRAKFGAIAEFSELGEFLERPLRTYSAGMLARLGFSVAVHLDPEVLLVDEVLAVGDIAFAAKCIDKMMSFRRRGVTILFVSHALRDVRNLCDRAIWLDSARIRLDGPADTVCAEYQRTLMP